jgi:hypothetical protein
VTRRLAQALVRRYPAAWRERYEREVSALIDDTSIRFRDLAELLRGLLTERARELVASDDRPMRTAATIGLLKVGFVLAFIGSAIGLGLGLRQLTGRGPRQLVKLVPSPRVVWFRVFVLVAIRARRRPVFSSFPPYNPGTEPLLAMFCQPACSSWRSGARSDRLIRGLVGSRVLAVDPDASVHKLSDRLSARASGRAEAASGLAELQALKDASRPARSGSTAVTR